MRWLLDRVGLRGGVVAGIVLLVAAAVAVGRMLGAAPASGPFDADLPSVAAVDPSAGDDAEVAATPSGYADDALVRARADQFITAWLRRDLPAGAWHARLEPLSTTRLAAGLVGVDPAGVPASRQRSEPELGLRNDSVARVSIAVDTGTVILTLLKQRGGWLVDAVDWQAS